jgi:hypothetical protein
MSQVLPLRSVSVRAMATQPVVLVHGTNTQDVAVWHFVRVESARMPLLQREAKDHAGIDASRYGEILASGMGDTPPPHIMNRMKAVYGYKG